MLDSDQENLVCFLHMQDSSWNFVLCNEIHKVDWHYNICVIAWVWANILFSWLTAVLVLLFHYGGYHLEINWQDDQWIEFP
jgi:hypothetical protein